RSRGRIVRFSARTFQIAASSVLLLALWEVVGRLQLLGITFPPLTTVVAELFAPHRSSLFLGAIGATATSAALGLVIGGGGGIALAALRHAVNPTRQGIDRLAAAI